MAVKPPIRLCAVYTRKSSEEGLEQEFNSLDAQYEAGTAYVKSQQHEGWCLVENRYDDGGVSGGTLERSGLKQLLTDIKAGKIQIVVVYKVDRLTRSLNDFAKLIEVFEAHKVSFVSVTQQFNTTTSMGRLMLNVLLSFAQFEREVTGERIRDKIAAYKKKGIWMGGTPPMGYRPKDRKLLIDEGEADVIRHVFTRYAELGSVSKVATELRAAGYRTRAFTSTTGQTLGGRPFTRGHIYQIINNPIYRGDIVHRDLVHPGEHEAIIDEALWTRVQQMLATNRQAFRADRNVKVPSLLKGLLFDDAGNAMSPTHGAKEKRRYRYYISQALLKGHDQEAGSVPRLPAADLEKVVAEAVLNHLTADPTTRAKAVALKAGSDHERHNGLREVIKRVQLGVCLLRIEVSQIGEDTVELEVPFKVISYRHSNRIVAAANTTISFGPDASLIAALVKGYKWREQLLSGEVKMLTEIARQENITDRYVNRILRLGFLAPDIMEAILEGRQPPGLTMEIFRKRIPLDWNDQRRAFGFAA